MTDFPPASEFSTLATQDLLAIARSGNDAAWEEFYQRYRNFLVFAVQMRIPGFVRPQFDAEDVLQSAFIQAWKEIESFQYRGEGSFRSWLRSIVINHFLNKLRANRRSEGSHDRQSLEQVAPVAAEHMQEDPADLVSLHEDRVRLLGKLQTMPEADQEILGMRIFEDLSWHRIATILECDRGTAHVRFGEAIKRLERLLR